MEKQPKSPKTKTRFYWTKKRKKELRKWQVLGVSFILAVIVIGGIGEFTKKQISKISIVPTVHAQVIAEEVIETVEDEIRRIASEENFKWTDYLVRLGKCESNLKQFATNGKGNSPAGSVDRGTFMFNDYWHPEVSDECAFSVDCSTREAIKLINAGRQSEFVCDRKI